MATRKRASAKRTAKKTASKPASIFRRSGITSSTWTESGSVRIRGTSSGTIVGLLHIPSAGGGTTELQVEIAESDLKRAIREIIEERPSKASGLLEAIRAGLRAAWTRQTQSLKEVAKAGKAVEKARRGISELKWKENWGSKKWKELEDIESRLRDTEFDLSRESGKEL